jgi:hypothetical protein
MTVATVSRLFETERAARAYFESQLQVWNGDLRLEPEVHLRHAISGQLLRIDYLAVFRRFRRNSTGPTLIGFEIKRYFDDFRHWTAALKQAIDYRHSVVEDARSTVWAGHTPAFVFVFPDLRDLGDLGEHDEYRSGWAEGAERLAGKYNVGSVRTRKDWRTAADFLELTCSADPLWNTRVGPRWGDAWGTRRRPGAER